MAPSPPRFSAPSSSASPRPSPVESLEDRRLCSVTVDQTFTGFYEIHGTDDADTIAFSVSMNGEAFTYGDQTYTGVQFIMVYAGGGDDTVALSSSDGPGWIGATVDGGGGADTITLNFDGAVYGGDGDDTMVLSDSFRGEARGEGGDDTITVSGECVDPEIVGGDGDDVIDASGNHYGVVIQGGLGNDTLTGSGYDDEIYAGEGDDTLYGCGGNDLFFVEGGGVDVIAGGGGGHDTVYGDAGDLITADDVEVVHLR